MHSIGGTAFVWNSKQQSILAASSVESEYITQAKCVKEALWIRKLLLDFGVVSKTIDIRGDDKGAIALAKGWKNDSATKHIDVAHHLTRDYCSKNVVSITYVSTKTMLLADCFTKALGTQKIRESRSAYGLRSNKED